ncbi:hypothetical protein N601_14650 [Rhodococcus erythropolis DN1]|nr:hypothetical protein N601_14650 [Rhodococcus erythropolis DN1]
MGQNAINPSANAGEASWLEICTSGPLFSFVGVLSMRA